MFLQTVGPVPHCMFDIVAATIGRHGRATGPPRPIHCCCCPQRIKSRGIKSDATYCYDRERADGTNHLRTLINDQLVPVHGARTLVHAHKSGTTCLWVGPICFFTKNDPLCMAYHPYHFVGEALLHPVYYACGCV